MSYIKYIAFAAVFTLVGCTQDPAPVTHYGVEEGAGSAGIHTVLQGDTLYSISKRYKIVMRDIAAANDLRAPFYLSKGQRLKLPPPREYRVRPRDTIYTVSRQFGVSLSELARLNGLSEPYVVRAGEVLRLPSGAEEVEESYEMAAVRQPERVQNREGKKKREEVRKKKRVKISSRTPKRSSGKFMKPVQGRVISSYGPKKGGLHNDGINIAAPRGTPVRAAENGVVVYSGNDLKGTGNLILVRHDDRWMSAYAHLDRVHIKRGQTIKRGQAIGTVGSTGSVDSPQLHFELRRGTKALNPQVYMGG